MSKSKSKPIPTDCILIFKVNFDHQDNSLFDFGSCWLLPRSEVNTIDALHNTTSERTDHPTNPATLPMIWSDVSIRYSTDGKKPHLARVYSRSWEELNNFEAFDCICVVCAGLGGYTIFVSKGHWPEKPQSTGSFIIGRPAEKWEMDRELGYVQGPESWEDGGDCVGGQKKHRWRRSLGFA
ncbi:hypothetical protein BDD12DRAFT_914479 [Trichophaea hybrida]|nr:hypothetical protein BDD12DRAFT_914479 [Trichophaea hybrida]